MLFTNLLTNLVLVTNMYALNGLPLRDHPGFDSRTIFSNYAASTALTNAKTVAEALSWDTSIFTKDSITRCEFTPFRNGIMGEIEIGGRYVFYYIDGRFKAAKEGKYDQYLNGFEGLSQRSRDRRIKELAESKDLLNKGTARKLAMSVFKKLYADVLKSARTNKDFVKLRVDHAAMYTHSPIGDVLVPEYWADLRFMADRGQADMIASATTNALIEQGCQLDLFGPEGECIKVDNNSCFLRLATREDYFQLLGYPTNTVFVLRRHNRENGSVYYESIDP